MPVTYYVALPFVRTEDGIAAGQGQECTNEHSAIRKAESMSRDATNIGSFADATILRSFGDIPENLDEL